MSDGEWRATDTLNKDYLIMIQPADKVRLTVVMNKDDYYKKCNEHLRDEKTYQRLKSDSTNKFRKKFVSSLKDLKDRKVINNVGYETITYHSPPSKVCWPT